MKRFQFLAYSILSGVLLWLSWPVNGFAFMLLFAFVPLLYIEDTIVRNKKQYSRFSMLLYAYLSFIIWNGLTTWWIYNSTLFGAVMAVVFNSLFMALAFWLFHITRRNIYQGRFNSGHYGYLALIAYWIGFEHFHLNWDLSWSWLNLGNGFSEYYRFIQWYEFTGTLGGSLWILISNILIFRLIKAYLAASESKNRLIYKGVASLLVIVLPALLSIYIYYSYSEVSKPVEIVCVQPNIDPYNEKFGGMTTEAQAEKIISLMKEKAGAKTKFFVAPETALPEGVWLDEIHLSPSVNKIKSFLQSFTDASVVIGATTYMMYEPGNESATARAYPGMESRYDVFNTALLIDTSSAIQHYHKSKLVPGVEKMPYPAVFGFLEEFAIDLGGMTGSHGVQDERSVLKSQSGIAVAPVICYESIYGDFVTGYVRNGAELIFIITNDGWWGETPGYRQHNSYARLRAIENRRSIARSANTGISSFLNQRGDIIQSTGWWEDAVINETLNANSELTFYSKNGDYIGRIMGFTALLFLLYTFVSLFIKKKV